MLSWRVFVAGLICHVGLVAGAEGGRAAMVSSSDRTAHKDQVAAAISHAVDALARNIGEVEISNRLTVDQFLAKTDGHDLFRRTLSRSEQIGGPRWIDQRTCQVRLEIAGARVADVLVQIAASNPKRSPLPAEVLATRLGEIERRSFSAIGTSTGSANIEDARPAEQDDAWNEVDDEARRQAVADAKRNAVTQLIESVRPVRLPDGKTVDDALSEPGASDELGQWLASRPVTGLRFGDNLEVEVQLAAEPQAFFDAFRGMAGTGHGDADSDAWARTREDFLARVAPGVGRGFVPGHGPEKQKTPPPAALADAPPSWVNDEAMAEGVAKPMESKLRTARAAEANARENLRVQVAALPLDGHGGDLGSVSNSDSRIKDALDRALGRAKTYHVQYEPDGSVRVKLVLPLRIVWEQIRGL